MWNEFARRVMTNIAAQNGARDKGAAGFSRLEPQEEELLVRQIHGGGSAGHPNDPAPCREASRSADNGSMMSLRELAQQKH